MYCINCGTKLDDGAKFCISCGSPQQPANQAPAYAPPQEAPPVEAPVEAPPVYAPPVEAPPPEPAYIPPQEAPPVYAPPVEAPPVYAPPEPAYTPPQEAPPVDAPPEAPPVEAPPVYAPPPEPAYTPPQEAPPPEPAYIPPQEAPPVEAPPEAPPVEAPPVYAPPEPAYTPPQEAPPVDAPPEPAYTPPQEAPPEAPPVEAPPMYAPPEPAYTPPQEPGYTPYMPPFDGVTPPPDGMPQGMPPAKKSGKKLLLILIPIAVVVLAAVALFLLELFEVIDIIPTFPDRGEAVISNPGDENNGAGGGNNSNTSPAASPSATSPTAPAPGIGGESPAPAPASGLRGDGGQVRITEEIAVQFTPDRSGGWMFFTSDNGESDPRLTIIDSNQIVLGFDDDGGDNYNAIVVVMLNAGETYTIIAEFYNPEEGGEYVLNVSSALSIPDGGGEIRIENSMKYLFSPNESGYWQFITSDNGISDPFIALFSIEGIFMTGNDDGAGDLNALLNVPLVAGEMYIVSAEFVSESDNGSYLLSVRFAPDAAPPPPISGELPSEGGEFYVSGPTDVTITPEISGAWAIFTSDSEMSDPFLEIYGDGELLAANDDNGADHDSFIVIYLQAGETYSIIIDFYSDYTYAGCMLHVKPVVSLAPEGGTVRVTGSTVYSFAPARSGTWQFYTSDNGASDPVIRFYSADGELMWLDDDGGENLNSWLIMELEHLTVYFIHADFYGGSGEYDLTIDNG